MNMFPVSLWLLKCENQPVTGAPQPLRTTPKWFRIQPEKSPKRKHAFELSAKAETWSSKLLFNLNHKGQFFLSSNSNKFPLFLYYILCFSMLRSKGDNARHHRQQCILPDIFCLVLHQSAFQLACNFNMTKTSLTPEKLRWPKYRMFLLWKLYQFPCVDCRGQL